MCSRTPPRSLRTGIRNLQDQEERTNIGDDVGNHEEDISPLETCKENMNFLEEVLIVGQKVTQNNVIELKNKLMEWLVIHVQLQTKIELLKEENEKLKKIRIANSMGRFADAVKKEIQPIPIRTRQIEENKDRAKNTIFIKGKKEEDIKEVQKTFTKAFNPAKEKIKISSMRSTTKALIVETESEEDIKKITSNKKIQAKLICEKQKKKRPLVILYNVPSEIKTEELTTDIYQQNFEGEMDEDTFQESFNPKFKTGPRDKAHVHHVIEVSPEMRKSILTKHKLYLRFSAISVKDFLTLAKCLRCHDYNHIGKYCRNEETCGHCGEENHTKANCQKKSQPAICVPCKKRKKICKAKEAKECLTYQLLLKRHISGIDYGQ